MELTEREKVLEERYIRDFERSLKVRDRRDRLLAKWVARTLARADATAYAEELAKAGRTEPGDEEVLRKILQDFEKAGIPATRNQLQEKMKSLLFLAAEQLDAESTAERR
ncbi:ATPase inhibitor subunit zeta [Sinorhizobium fredii]|uniref:ATPase inhibitor subunit zeta n=1 Tax=Rhizobium fredii TaxID=380 RepID=UPI0005955CE4|nr:ATPase inhibitor subunit zeta [Sinorhizobium fredii]WOS65380.1 ATPase inhibitor subunit zeta [Sinorhizobium fredii GR64]